MIGKIRLVGPLLLLLLLVLSFGNVTAQEGVNQWLRYDVNLNLQQNSGLAVEEINQVALDSGVSSFTKVIPTGKLEAVDNIQVLELSSGGGQRGYVKADTEDPYTFQVMPAGDETTVTLYFPPNTAASTTLVIRYFVTGAVRFYESGDKLDWRPYGTGTTAPVESSTITISLPSGLFTPEQITQSSVGVSTDKFVPDGHRAIFQATGIPSGGELEVTLTLPHEVIQGAAPAWQVRADSLEFWTPVLKWVSVIFGLLILIFGPLAAYGWWYARLRVIPGGKAAKYVKSPPGNLPPAMAGVLLDGYCTPRHLMATLLDLGYRGALHAYPGQDSGDADYMVVLDEEETAEEDVSFDLYGADQSKASRPFEEALYTKIFGFQGGYKRNIADIKNLVFMSVPEMKNQVDAEAAKAGFFPDAPNRVRQQYLAFGGAAIILSLILGLLAAAIFSSFTLLVICPFLGIVVAAAAFIVVGFAAPRRTEKGEKLAFRWTAFKRYLKDLNVKEAEKSPMRFSRLLPYAVAFGVDKGLVEKFARAKSPAPKWWSIPPQKAPDVGRQGAQSWVGAGQMAEASQATPGMPKKRIRRLGDEVAEQQKLLADIQPVFEKFLHDGFELFSKAPGIDEDEEIDFDSLADKK